MLQPRYFILALALMAILAVGLIAFHERSSSVKSDRVRVISGRANDARSLGPADPTIVSTPAATTTAPGDDLTALVRTSFPAMRDVVTRCEASLCETVMSTDVPPGGNALSSYEDIVRHELASTFRAHGRNPTEDVQIEEIGGDQVRLRIRVSR
jgi:hypothetical protein